MVSFKPEMGLVLVLMIFMAKLNHFLPYGCLFSRVIYFRCFRGCLHDLRKLKKYQNFDPKNVDSAMAKFSS